MGTAGAGSGNSGNKFIAIVKNIALGADDQYDTEDTWYSKYIPFANCARLSAMSC